VKIMTTTQLNNADALFREIARLPEGKQIEYVRMMKAVLLGASLAEQARNQPDAAPAQ
jgi:hypothetical protein